MKNTLLITTALVAVLSAANVNAKEINRKEIITNSKTLSESVEGLHSTKGHGGVYYIGDTSEAITVTVDKGLTYKDNSSVNTAGVFSVQASHTLNIGSGVIFEGNKTVNNGGAIYANEAKINIDDNVNFIGNNAQQGQGGVIMATSVINVGNGLFERNSAGTDGGAILNALVEGKNASSLTLNGTTFKNNTAGGEGGAIASFSTLNVDNARFEENTAKGNEAGDYDGGGAILVGSSSVSNITNTKFIKNHANGTIGGAIATRRNHNNLASSSLTIENSLFDANDANDGGAFYNAFSNNVSVSNSTFTGNTAITEGGAIFNESKGVLSLSGNNVFSGNTANGVLNDIHNLGTIDVSGSLTLDGGVSGNGTLTLAKGTNLNVKTGTTTISNNVVNKGANLGLTFDNGYTGGKYKLITNGGTLDNEFNIAENGIYNITSVANGSYDISKKSTDEISATTGANANQAGAINAITSGNSGSASFDNIANNISTLMQSSNKGDVQSALDATTALAPEVAPMVQQNQSETANQVFSAVGTRLSGGSVSTGGEGMSSGDSMFKRGAMWVQGMFNKSKLDDTSKAKGFDADSNGIAFGAEKYLNDDVKAGIGYAYTNTDIDGFMRSTDVDTHTAIVYGEYKPSNWYVNGIATYGWSDYSEHKNVAGVGVKADYDAETFGLQAMTGYDMQVRGFGLTPEVGMRYVHISQDGYKDSADQKVSANDSDILTAVIGAKVNKSFELTNGMNIKPEARVAMTYDLMNDDANSVVTLANGSAYSVNGEALDRFGMEFGAGVTAEVNDNVELSLGYEGKFREDYQDHTGLINAKYKF